MLGRNLRTLGGRDLQTKILVILSEEFDGRYCFALEVFESALDHCRVVIRPLSELAAAFIAVAVLPGRI